MDRRTRKALKDSILKWEQIARGEMIDDGARNCALCEEFLANDCRGCPVSEYIGRLGCYNTPYTAWVSAATRRHGLFGELVADTPELVEKAGAERDFLIRVLEDKRRNG